MLRFSDGMEINTSGKLRTVHESDGWYVTGGGMLIAVESEEEGEAWIRRLEEKMRIGPDDKFWVVIDPTPNSTIGDVLFETTLHGLELQFKGGLTSAARPALYADEAEAEADALGRLKLREIANILEKLHVRGSLAPVARIQLLDTDGNQLNAAEIPAFESR